MFSLFSFFSIFEIIRFIRINWVLIAQSIVNRFDSVFDVNSSLAGVGWIKMGKRERESKR